MIADLRAIYDYPKRYRRIYISAVSYNIKFEFVRKMIVRLLDEYYLTRRGKREGCSWR